MGGAAGGAAQAAAARALSVFSISTRPSSSRRWPFSQDCAAAITDAAGSGAGARL
jgi:hypothetical protein